MRESLANMDNTHNVTTRDIARCKKSMYRARRKSIPTLPKSEKETVEKLSSLNMQTSRGENFVMTSEMVSSKHGIVIYSCPSNLKQLCASEIILGDRWHILCCGQVFHSTIHASRLHRWQLHAARILPSPGSTFGNIRTHASNYNARVHPNESSVSTQNCASGL